MDGTPLNYPPTTTGIAIGNAHCLPLPNHEIPRYWLTIDQVENEISRFNTAIEITIAQLEKIKNSLCSFSQNDQGNILDTHILLLQDAQFSKNTQTVIAEKLINAEWALAKVTEQLVQIFSTVNIYLKQRRDDIEQVSWRLMRNLCEEKADQHKIEIKNNDTILIAYDLSPGEIASLPRNLVTGIITARGGPSSHSAIIARSLSIPTQLGATAIFRHVKDKDKIIIDADNGKILINPDDRTIAEYRTIQEDKLKNQNIYLKNVHLNAETTDNIEVLLGANIELPDEIPNIQASGANHIGLFRTEYLFINRYNLPDEEEQFNQYRKVLEDISPKYVVARTLDIGGDKLLEATDLKEYNNPAMGLRAIRFSLHEKELFLTQLRALLRASIYGELHLMFPLLTCIEELAEAKRMYMQACNQLEQQGIQFDKNIPIGIMIETPAAALLANEFANEAAFFCIGTNDLTQHALAADRTNDQVAYLFSHLHPAVLRLIKSTVDAAKIRNIPVSLCGEMSSDPLCIALLIGLGVNNLSMNAISLPRVKNLIRRISWKEANELSTKILEQTTTSQVTTLLRQFLEKYEAA